MSRAILGISISWFYKWFGREPIERARRRAALDAKVRELFKASNRTYGSPRIHADLVEAGETVSVNTVADSMRRQDLQGRKPKRRRGLTRQDRTAPKFPDLVHRDFTALAPNVKWRGDFKCRRRHFKSYADPRNMPILLAMVQANGGVEVQKVGIVA
ncbi:MAG: putative transposase [Pseudonocardiales bacterium]|nr:putative transposase [Pseudonocardiales bacterium]